MELNLSNYRERIVDKQIDNLLKVCKAICIEGPKWCGKTWTSFKHCNSSFFISDPNKNFQNKQLAQLDVSLCLNGEKPHLIDEWQEIPSIWDAVRFDVDKTTDSGQFILTGSSTPKKKGIIHSGAGRIVKVRMDSMSSYEMGFSTGDISLLDLFNNKFENKIIKSPTLNDIANMIVKGGWPALLDKSVNDSIIINRNYVESLLNDDQEADIDMKYKPHKMELLLKSLARNECSCASNNKLLNDIKEFDKDSIDISTLLSYIDILKRKFILINQPPFSIKARSRIRLKQFEKLHFSDPSIACAILKLTPEMILNELNLFGLLFESLCERDLRIYSQAFNASLYHYQDYDNDEIDAILQLNDSRYAAIEIKLGFNKVDQAANSLLKISNKLIKQGLQPPSYLIVLCGLCDAAFRREDGVYVLPIAGIKD